MEIDQLTVTPISLTFRMKASLHESDDFVPLGTPVIVFPRQRYRDGKPLSGTISKTIQVTLRYVVIASCINIEYNVDAEEKYSSSSPWPRIR